MPELPFIQVLVENLAREIEGHTIVSVRVPSPAIVKTFDPPVSALAGRRIERVRRIGKLIVSDLSDDLLLVMHLMRDGRLQIARAGSAARKGRASPATRWPGCTPPSGAYLLPRCRSTGPVLERSCQRASRLSCSACTGTGASRARAAAHASKQSTLPIRKPTIARRVRPAARFTLIDGCRDC